MGFLDGVGDFFNGVVNVASAGALKNTDQIFSMLPFGIGQGFVGQENLTAQQQNYQYQQALQQEMFNRDDDAVQRRQADLEAAGLSPTLAAGSSAEAGPVIQTSAPQRPAGPGLNLDLASQALALMSADANIDKTRQDTDTSAALASKYDSEQKLTELQTSVQNYDWGKYSKYGIPTNTGGGMKELTGVGNLFDDFFGKIYDYLKPKPGKTNIKKPVPSDLDHGY
nr:MAG: DNA pilot protein [Microviridae sp.]